MGRYSGNGSDENIKHAVFRSSTLFLLGITLTGIGLFAHCLPLFSPVHTVFLGYGDIPKEIDPECQTPATYAAQSNGVRFTVVSVTNDLAGYYRRHCIIDWENDRIRYLRGRGQTDTFEGWTVSQRYGIFITSSHYGVNETIVFDTVQWEIVPEAGTECAMPYAMTPCYAGLAAISPVADQYLNRRGEIVDITTGTRIQLPSKERRSVYEGTWSPDGTYLVYLVSEQYDISVMSVLFLTLADGSLTREIAELALPFQWTTARWHWSPDGQQLSLTAGEDVDSAYVLDLATGRLHREPGP